jgi:iron complex outermembrane receptor protein
VALCLLTCAVPAAAQQPTAPQVQGDKVVIEEHVVVTASRVEEELVNAPAAVSVVSGDTIQRSAGTALGDVLRAVPGVNVTQTSARDVNLTSRAATGTLATSQLALVDGRSVYLDFFGMVMWDLISADRSEIKQIEVIRGPASAVWGANAMNGVVNVITKSPRELAAEGRGSLTVGVGVFDRDVKGRDAGAGSLFSVSAVYPRAIDERWAYKVSASYFTQDPLPRPTGVIPNTFQTPYPAFENSGTSQPKFDGRVDRDLAGGGRLSVRAGVAGTDGVLYSGIGPFKVDRGSRLVYTSARYERGGRHIAFFANLLNGTSSNLVTAGSGSQRLALDFATKTFDVEATEVRTIARRHLLNFGGNFRRNTFDFSLALSGADRSEGGGFLQDEIFLGDHVRWIVGSRIDKFSSIDDPVWSPRTTLLLKPAAAHTVRLSFNRAFRAPSYTNNNIDTDVVSELNLGLINPAFAGLLYTFPVHAVGNKQLKQETMTAYEIGYAGIIAQRVTVSAALYWNVTDDAVFFTQTGRYTAASPPPGWPLPPIVLELAAAAGAALPSEFSYRNLGTVRERGVELGADAVVSPWLSGFGNYSYQRTPDVTGFPLSEINLPPTHRFNVGLDLHRGRAFGGVSVHYTDDAFWQDVLDARFHGVTDAFTLVNTTGGIRWLDGRVITSLKVFNLTNRAIMQHIFGDVVKRQIVAEARVAF